jgi:hypothetical protein
MLGRGVNDELHTRPRGAQRKRARSPRRRDEEAERKRLDGNRWQRFVELATQWQQAELADRFLTAIEARLPPGAEQASAEAALIPDWLAWLRRQVTRRDPLGKGVRAVAANLSSVTSWTYRLRES